MASSVCSVINCESSTLMNGCRLSTVNEAIIQNLDVQVGLATNNQPLRCSTLIEQTTTSKADRRSLESERRRLRRSLETPEERQQRLDKQRERQRSFINRESSHQRHQRLIKDAARHRMKREMETFEERFVRQNQDSARRNERRSNETAEERQQRLARERQRQCNHRSRETSLQRSQRLTKDAARHRIKREFESFEERFRRQSQDSARHRERRSRETPEERQQRLDKQRQRQQNVISRETSVERQQRLDKERQRQSDVRRRETWLQRHQRLTKDAARHRMKREMETFEERFMRQNQESARQNERRSRETSVERQSRRARDALSHRNRRNRNASKSQMPFCCVPGCTSQSSGPATPLATTAEQQQQQQTTTVAATNCVSLHEIPANDELRTKWLQAISLRTDLSSGGSMNGIINDSSRTVICSEHFLPTDYIKLEITSGRRLMPAAVPSVFACPLHFSTIMAQQQQLQQQQQQQQQQQHHLLNLKSGGQWPTAVSSSSETGPVVDVLVDVNFEPAKAESNGGKQLPPTDIQASDRPTERSPHAITIENTEERRPVSNAATASTIVTVNHPSTSSNKMAKQHAVHGVHQDAELNRLRKDYAEVAKELHEAHYSNCRIRLHIDPLEAAMRSANVESEKSAAFLVDQMRLHDEKKRSEASSNSSWSTSDNTGRKCGAAWQDNNASGREAGYGCERLRNGFIARIPSPNKEGVADWSLLVTQHLQDHDQEGMGSAKEQSPVTSDINRMGQ